MNKKTPYQKYVMGKYDKLCMEVLTSKWQNTNMIVKKLKDKHKKWVSWHLVHRALSRLEKGGNVECASDGKFFMWRLKGKDG